MKKKLKVDGLLELTKLLKRGAGGKEEAKKTQTKQKYFGKCLLTSDAEA